MASFVARPLAWKVLMCIGMSGNGWERCYPKVYHIHIGIERFFDLGAHIRTIDNVNCWTQHKDAVLMGISGNALQRNLLTKVESAFKVIL